MIYRFLSFEQVLQPFRLLVKESGERLQFAHPQFLDFFLGGLQLIRGEPLLHPLQIYLLYLLLVLRSGLPVFHALLQVRFQSIHPALHLDLPHLLGRVILAEEPSSAELNRQVVCVRKNAEQE